MFVCCECRVLSGRGLCDELITRPEESYRLWCVVVCDVETSRMRKLWPTGGCCAQNKNCNEIYVKELFIHMNKNFNMADTQVDEIVSAHDIGDISNANKENKCECYHKLKQELNVTLQDLR